MHVNRIGAVDKTLMQRIAIGCVILVVLTIARAIQEGVGNSPTPDSGLTPSNDSSNTALPRDSEVVIANAEAPAVLRVRMADELEDKFASSMLGNLELRFAVRGDNCDVLHVEGYNLYKSMMEALAYGTVLYGRVLPGGVNARAEQAGFRDIVYTNRADNVVISFGPSKLGAAQAKRARKCDEATAAEVTEPTQSAQGMLAGPEREPLSWSNVRPGLKLYDASLTHVVTVVSTDEPNDLIEVQYVNGPREQKQLSAVARGWYVLK